MVVDTNIFIEHLRAKDKQNTTLSQISSDRLLYISSVTLYELFMGGTDIRKWNDVKVLTENLTVLPFDEAVSIRAAQIYHDLRKINKVIGFRDIFIAATCLVHNLPLKTYNKSDFSRINSLAIE